MLTHRQSVIAALREHGAELTNLSGLRFAPVASVATFTLG
nr:hypothetical protein JVH1_4165 [Rhodococcus sp. JVH1]